MKTVMNSGGIKDKKMMTRWHVIIMMLGIEQLMSSLKKILLKTILDFGCNQGGFYDNYIKGSIQARCRH